MNGLHEGTHLYFVVMSRFLLGSLKQFLQRGGGLLPQPCQLFSVVVNEVFVVLMEEGDLFENRVEGDEGFLLPGAFVWVGLEVLLRRKDSILP